MICMEKNQSYPVVLTTLLVVAAFFIGSLTTKVKYLEQGVTPLTTQPAGTTAQQVQQAQPAAPSATIEEIKALFTEKNITFGDKNSKNLLVEVADPSCPYCHVAAGHNPELAKQMGTQFLTAADGG